jgi:hypothetical protein
MLVWAAISYQLQKPIHRIWMNIIHLSIQRLPEIWQLVGGNLLWTSNCILLKCKVEPKTGQFGKPIFFSQFWSKSSWHCFLAGIRWHSSLPPLAFSFCLDFYLGWAVISCRNTYIEYGWTWCICQYNDCLEFGNSWGYLFVQVKLPSLMSKVVKTWSIWETHFFPQSCSKSYPKSKNDQSAGFHTCFRYGNIVIPMVFAVAVFVHSKILPHIFLPQIFINILIFVFFLSTPEGLNKCIFYVCDHDYIVTQLCIHIYI